MDSRRWISSLVLGLIVLCHWVQSAPQSHSNRNQQAADYSVTHLDIRDAILSLVSVLRDQMDKLERHEVRERQLGEQLTRSLASLEKRGRGEEKNIENIATYVSRMEDKLIKLQTVVDKQNDDRRLEHGQTLSEFKTLAHMLGPGTDLSRRVDDLGERLNFLRETAERNSGKFDSLMELWRRSSGGSGNEGSDSILQELGEIKEALQRTQEADKQLNSKGEGQSDWQTEMMENMDAQRKQLAILEEEIGKAIGLLGDMTKSASGLQGVMGLMGSEGSAEVNSSVIGPTLPADMEYRLSRLQELMKNSQSHLEQRIKDAENVVASLVSRMESGYDKLAQELKGLANVESVLLDTGDSVLDTKRRLEYGVQQIVGELNQQLTQHTSKLNASIQQRFDGLTNSVLGNQSMALTNLTSRMEEEISQVWRQIGILYHQMSRSANLLDEIHSQTSKYVNNSLDTMSSMDGKVGQITNRMGEVDDNLNYLLGRMSLVVQEFNMIKTGLGDALGSLKDSFNDIAEIERKPDTSVEIETNTATE